MGSSGFLFYFLSVDSQHVGVEDAHTYMGDSHVKNRCENRLRFFFFLNKFDLFFFLLPLVIISKESTLPVSRQAVTSLFFIITFLFFFFS